MIRFNTLWFRLTAAFLAVAAVGIIVVAGLANQVTAARFQAFLSDDSASEWIGLQGALADYYEAQGGWDGVIAILGADQPGRGQGQGGGGTSIVLLNETGTRVALAGGQRNNPASLEDADVQLPIEVKGRVVGTLLVREPGGQGNGAGEQYLTAVNRAIWLGGLAAVAVALLLGIVLAGRLTRPLRQLTQASQELAEGDWANRSRFNHGGR